MKKLVSILWRSSFGHLPKWYVVSVIFLVGSIFLTAAIRGFTKEEPDRPAAMAYEK